MLLPLSWALLFSVFVLSRGQDISEGDIPSCEKITEIEGLLKKLILDNEVISDSVRFGFHSCVGGCDGCLRIKQADNKGLDIIYDLINKFYTDNNLAADGISRADIWPMLAVLAVDAAMDNHAGVPLEKPCFKYYWGRADCPTSPDLETVFEFPQPSMSSENMFEYFLKTFEFTPNEVVPIMGAHSLGKADINNNGFNGMWTPGEDTAFNTTYYENMLVRDLKYVNVDATAAKADSKEPHWQWEAKVPNGISMMFNTDFDLFFDVTVDAKGKAACTLDPTCVGKNTCGKDNTCKLAPTDSLAKEYIVNPQKFYHDFRKAFSKMLRTGFRSVTSRGNTCGICTEA